MRRWVVTGPMGAGKSLATATLAQLGAAVVDGDKLGHEVLVRPEVVERIREAFGPEVAPDGQVDRSILGPLVFADPGQMARLNAITHGPIAELASQRLAELAAAREHELAVLDAAMYFLFPAPPAADLIIAVVADEEERIERLVRQRGLDPDSARQRVAAQRNLAPFWSRADILLENSGSAADLQQAVTDLFRASMRT